MIPPETESKRARAKASPVILVGVEGGIGAGCCAYGARTGRNWNNLGVARRGNRGCFGSIPCDFHTSIGLVNNLLVWGCRDTGCRFSLSRKRELSLVVQTICGGRLSFFFKAEPARLDQIAVEDVLATYVKAKGVRLINCEDKKKMDGSTCSSLFAKLSSGSKGSNTTSRSCCQGRRVKKQSSN